MNLIRYCFLTLALMAALSVHAIEGIEEDISPINALMADVIVKIKSHRVDEAVNAFVDTALPSMHENVKLDWKKKLLGFMMMLEERNIESLELVAFDKISSQSYELHYILHGDLGPHMISFKAYRYDGKWHAIGFSYVSEYESLAKVLRDKSVLDETVKIPLPEQAEE